MGCGFVQDGQVAEIKVKLRAGDTLVIDTVAGNVQLNALRRFLNEGFQAHLQSNELLHQASATYAACTPLLLSALPFLHMSYPWMLLRCTFVTTLASVPEQHMIIKRPNLGGERSPAGCHF